MSFGHPYLLLTLLVVPLALGLYWLSQRRRMRYAVRYTNVDVLALVAEERRPWRRYLPPALLLAALAALCVGLARPHVNTLVTKDKATVVLVLDVSGSMQANDVKPSRLAAAQKALQTFIAKAPKRVRIGLILFAADPEVATPPTSDHELVSQAVADAGLFRGFGGTAIGDAIAAAVQVGVQSVGVAGETSALGSQRTLASTPVAASGQGTASSLVSILFLSDGHQTRGVLSPLQGAARAKAAGIPVYTVALGTLNGRITNFGFGGGGGQFGGGGGNQSFGFARSALQPDPATLRAIARETGGEFYRANSAGAVQAAYSKLGSSLGRTPARTEITDAFVGGAAVLLVLAGLLAALWSPRLP